MNGDTLVVVQCYAGDVDQVERALPQYLHHGHPFLVISPTDEPAMIDHPGVECRTAGLDAYIGPESLERHRAQLALLLEYPQRHFLLHESDSFCLSPRLPDYLYADDEIVWSNEVDTREHIDRNDDPDRDGTYERFPYAMQAPWFFSRASLEAMLDVFDEAAATLPDYAKFIDWWFLAASRLAALQRRTFPDGISRPIWHGNEIMRARELVRRRGVIMVHSVKGRDALATLIVARLEAAT